MFIIENITDIFLPTYNCEQELCEPISLSLALTRPLLGSERRSSAPTLYATLVLNKNKLASLEATF